MIFPMIYGWSLKLFPGSTSPTSPNVNGKHLTIRTMMNCLYSNFCFKSGTINRKCVGFSVPLRRFSSYFYNIQNYANVLIQYSWMTKSAEIWILRKANDAANQTNSLCFAVKNKHENRIVENPESLFKKLLTHYSTTHALSMCCLYSLKRI